MRNPGDQLDHGVFALRAVRDLLCGAERSLHVDSNDLYFLLALVVRELEEASSGFEARAEGRRAA